MWNEAWSFFFLESYLFLLCFVHQLNTHMCWPSYVIVSILVTKFSSDIINITIANSYTLKERFSSLIAILKYPIPLRAFLFSMLLMSDPITMNVFLVLYPSPRKAKVTTYLRQPCKNIRFYPKIAIFLSQKRFSRLYNIIV